jgi:hypothetical protein
LKYVAVMTWEWRPAATKDCRSVRIRSATPLPHKSNSGWETVGISNSITTQGSYLAVLSSRRTITLIGNTDHSYGGATL